MLSCHSFRKGIFLSAAPLTIALATSSLTFTFDWMSWVRCLENALISCSRAASLDSRVKTGTNPWTMSLEISDVGETAESAWA
ncbi:hypothetical protein BDW74DRAFT_156051 [Aspergillus multicolor]|uniref:uncharacterized protein n=1 Tax=Aspergillus multicolor TaxID=41759 RepID=UPI003CCE2096